VKEPVVIDAEYRALEDRFEVPWRGLLWMVVFAGGLAFVSLELNSPAASAALIVIAAFLWPISRAISLVAAPQLSEQQAQQMRRRLAGGWDQAEAERGRREATKAARRASRHL
jgi:hypothetical protein